MLAMENDGTNDMTNASIVVELLREADPENLYLAALSAYPYMMTPDQISEFTGLTSQGVRKVLARGELLGARIGNRWLIPKLSLLRYLHSGSDKQGAQKEALNGKAEMRQTLQR